MKNTLIVESANNKKQLKDIEDKILKVLKPFDYQLKWNFVSLLHLFWITFIKQVLSSSQGNILEDETAIQILSSSKILSEEIAEKQKVATATEEVRITKSPFGPNCTLSFDFFPPRKSTLLATGISPWPFTPQPYFSASQNWQISTLCIRYGVTKDGISLHISFSWLKMVLPR